MSRGDLEKTIKDTIIKCRKISFGVDSTICIECLNKLQKQSVIDQSVHDQKLIKDAVRKLAWDRLRKNTVVDDDLIKQQKNS